MPAHAYLDSSGRDWVCERGFKRDFHTCVRLELPDHAHLGYAGNRWVCDSGYRQEGQACIVSTDGAVR